MKIQFLGGAGFTLSNSKNKVVFNTTEGLDEKTDIAAFAEPATTDSTSAKKTFNLPGEFEVSGILAHGLYSDDRNNIVFKVVIEEMGIVHFGNLKEVPNTAFFEKLGENVDVIILTLSEDFDAKKAKTLIDTIDPRMAILGGDPSQFPKMVETAGAKTAEENPMEVKRSALSDDKTEVIIMNQ